MKVLTTLTIIMTIPNIVFGFFGMNIGEGQIPGDWVWWMPLAITAVSYTHLDVYKRQEEGHRRAGRAAAQYADALYAYGPDAAAMVAGAREKGMEHAYAFDDQTALVAALREDAKKGDALLFKGSRGMRMERALAMFLGEEVEA